MYRYMCNSACILIFVDSCIAVMLLASCFTKWRRCRCWFCQSALDVALVNGENKTIKPANAMLTRNLRAWQIPGENQTKYTIGILCIADKQFEIARELTI